MVCIEVYVCVKKKKKEGMIAHQGNVHQNHNETPLHIHQDEYCKEKKKEQKRNVGEAVEELEPSRIAGENVKWCSRCEK